MKTNFQRSIACIWILILIVETGCGKAQTSALSKEQVGRVAENILQAINAGDYEAFVKDFSDKMKEAFSEEEFQKLHDLLAETSGAYISKGEPQLTNVQGYVRYSYPSKFEREEVAATFVFAVGGSKVEGLFFDSQNLRKVNQ